MSGGGKVLLPPEIRLRMRVDHDDRDPLQAVDAHGGPERATRLELLELLDDEVETEVVRDPAVHSWGSSCSAALASQGQHATG